MCTLRKGELEILTLHSSKQKGKRSIGGHNHSRHKKCFVDTFIDRVRSVN